MNDLERGQAKVRYQNDLVKRLEITLNSDSPDLNILGSIKNEDFECISIWVLTQLGWTGESVDNLLPMLNFTRSFDVPENGFLLSKYQSKMALEGVSVETSKEKYIETLKKGYAIKGKLEAMYNKHRQNEKQKATKVELAKPKNKKWYD